MEIIKVIVDELPKDCDKCPFPAAQLHTSFLCTLMTETHPQKDMLKFEIDWEKRPSWCPLVKEGE